VGSPRSAPAAEPADDEVRGSPRRTPAQVDVVELLRCYRRAIELATDPPPSRSAGFEPLTRLLTWMRPTWGLRRMVVEHVRGRVARLDRLFARRLALNEDHEDDEQNRKALGLFAASLPPPRSRYWIALPLLAVVVVSQVLLELLQRSREPSKTPSGQQKPPDDDGVLPQKVLADLISVLDLNPGNLTKAVNTLLTSSPKVTALVIGLLVFSVYLVWRPLLPAFRLMRIIFTMPGATGRRSGESPLGKSARRLSVHDAEVRLFAALDERPPNDPELDLWLKLAPVTILAALALFMFVPPGRLPISGSVLAALAAVRLAFVLRAARSRRQPAAPRTPQEAPPADRAPAARARG